MESFKVDIFVQLIRGEVLVSYTHNKHSFRSSQSIIIGCHVVRDGRTLDWQLVLLLFIMDSFSTRKRVELMMVGEVILTVRILLQQVSVDTVLD